MTAAGFAANRSSLTVDVSRMDLDADWSSSVSLADTAGLVEP